MREMLLTLDVLIVDVGRGVEIVLVCPEPGPLPEVGHAVAVDGGVELVVQDVVGQGVAGVQGLGNKQRLRDCV